MTALAVHGLDKSFGGLRVTSRVDLAVAPGERRLIIGPNGAGKTTLFNLITGELRPDRGRITLFGDDITKVPGRRRAHLGIARTYQIITLFPRETLPWGFSPTLRPPVEPYSPLPLTRPPASPTLDIVSPVHQPEEDAPMRDPREARFIQEYLVDLNATGAARRAGYSHTSATDQGHVLLSKPDV